MLIKYKKEITIFLIFFLIYFLLGTIITYYFNTSNFWNVLFEMDTPRVLGDLSLINYNHYRISVHPLLIIIFQPIVIIMTKILSNSIFSILLLQALCASLSTLMIFYIIKKLTKNIKISLLLTTLFSMNYGQLIFASSIETYVFAQFFLILLWLFVIIKIDKEFNYWDYIILVLLGIFSIAITVTNFFQFVIAVFVLISLNKKIPKRYLTSFLILFITSCISITLAEVQNIIWPSAPNFFTKIINDFLYGTSEETLYMSKNISFKNILNVINSNFAFSYHIFNLEMLVEGDYIDFSNSIISNSFSIISALIFLSLNLWFIIKNKKNIIRHKVYLGLLLTYCFNFCLHLIYGNNISFLYICHYNFIIIFIIVYILKELFNFNKIKIKNNIYYIIYTIISLFCIRSIYLTIKLLFPYYNVIKDFSLFPIIILFIVLLFLYLILIKNKKLKILLIITTLLLSLMFYTFLNKNESCSELCSVYEKYEESLNLYKYQLKEMKNLYDVRNYSDRNEEIKVYFFGMADRRKIIYKEGKLIDAFSEEIIKEFEYDRELIVPNEYTVIIENDNNIYKIYENEKGIYIDENGKIITLDESEDIINLPEFDSHKYSELLKVLHQEVLFNIKKDVPTPNIFGYKTAWYRDTMLGTKVLEITDNTNILTNWLNDIDSIYDYSRSKDIPETDNLGELLYILGAVSNQRSDLIEDILIEIERIKLPNKSIKGIIDGVEQAYYPTVLALYGAEKLGITIDLKEPNEDDGYAKLTWYYPKKISTNSFYESKLFPYINWAYYHYSNHGKLFILDEIYPLSYESSKDIIEGTVQNECFISKYYCEKGILLSHMWHASEMFLFLVEEE